jgi:hypothetical protein
LPPNLLFLVATVTISNSPGRSSLPKRFFLGASAVISFLIVLIVLIYLSRKKTFTKTTAAIAIPIAIQSVSASLVMM